ncbi:Fe-S cluster assembly transcription factor [Kingella negevensis]|uniref:HTH-type transcriptional regulator IscR n=1 Tax=Kingella negevensis TaxID=1522312 RepID=A0A238HGS5_9NEIS|nr:Fe-S cluster assembly transcription factor [Kingella negevensis]MDK4679875.1 Fe-S cluster assembly transcription factor [Kingella negevensis]MDK4682406.1 Fe-S cluster assembly transcription factor [Kingella negevensis]MDK4690603.1 Fe-S cluster assembly transcription factor [Kingella negevensis]MDK4692048.1 Fe-S cluster assembly transcription factor [Kingella negevensis]MDK4696198.1 Fe-S cluster assembly transcription factor [Kingella negevensis]
MRLTTKGRFAVTAMIDLAMNAQYNAVKLNAISERQKISLSYLEQLFSKLRRAGLVESIRGPGGGYILGKPADQINIAQIITAAEDKLDATLCNRKANCHGGAPCITHGLWENLNQTIDNYLSNITLASLLEQENQNKNSEHVVSLTHIH